jgi:hypothetical protein
MLRRSPLRLVPGAEGSRFPPARRLRAADREVPAQSRILLRHGAVVMR